MVFPDNEKRRIFHALFIPSLFILLLWLVKIIEATVGNSFYLYGVAPRKIQGLIGVFSSPFIHANFKHLFNNSVPLLVLQVALFYLYRPIHIKVFAFCFLGAGIGTWAIGIDGYHIGASGVLYGIWSFLFTSGIIRGNLRLMAFSAFIALFYGSMVWGLFPIDYQVSWEAHASGAFIGFLLAIVYRRQGPQKEIHVWKEDDSEDEELNLIALETEQNKIDVNPGEASGQEPLIEPDKPYSLQFVITCHYKEEKKNV